MLSLLLLMTSLLSFCVHADARIGLKLDLLSTLRQLEFISILPSIGNTYTSATIPTNAIPFSKTSTPTSTNPITETPIPPTTTTFPTPTALEPPTPTPHPTPSSSSTSIAGKVGGGLVLLFVLSICIITCCTRAFLNKRRFAKRAQGLTPGRGLGLRPLPAQPYEAYGGTTYEYDTGRVPEYDGGSAANEYVGGGNYERYVYDRAAEGGGQGDLQELPLLPPYSARPEGQPGAEGYQYEDVRGV